MTEAQFRTHRVYAWSEKHLIAFNTGPDPTVAYTHIEDLMSGPPAFLRVARWADGHLEIGEAVPWKERPRRLT